MSVNIFYYQYLNMDLRTKLMNKFKEKLKSKLDITRGKKCNFIKKKKQIGLIEERIVILLAAIE